MKIGISGNSTRDIGFATTVKCLAYLTKQGVNCFVCADISAEFPTQNLPVTFMSRHQMMREMDMVVIFGGDGTVLKFLDGVKKFNAPILAVNMGNLGYLTECGVNELETVLDYVIKGQFKVEKRFLLSASFASRNYYALNEVLLSRGTRLNTLPISVYLDDEFTQTFCGDGVMVSTPTGSTAYSLSAGGPILSPDVSAYLVTPVCPHSLNVRPMVVSDDKILKMECIRPGASAHIYIDGRDKGALPVGEKLTVKKSDAEVKFVRINNVNFYSKILKSLEKRK